MESICWFYVLNMQVAAWVGHTQEQGCGPIPDVHSDSFLENFFSFLYQKYNKRSPPCAHPNSGNWRMKTGALFCIYPFLESCCHRACERKMSLSTSEFCHWMQESESKGIYVLSYTGGRLKPGRHVLISPCHVYVWSRWKVRTHGGA